MRYFVLFCAVFLLAAARADIEQRALLGTWFRAQERASIEITFARDGAFSERITFATDRTPATRIEGRWVLEGDTVKITLPSNAPVGVTPSPNRIVMWRIEKVSGAELSVSEGEEKWRFAKKK